MKVFKAQDERRGGHNCCQWCQKLVEKYINKENTWQNPLYVVDVTKKRVGTKLFNVVDRKQLTLTTMCNEKNVQ